MVGEVVVIVMAMTMMIMMPGMLGVEEVIAFFEKHNVKLSEQKAAEIIRASDTLFFNFSCYKFPK